MIETLLIIWFTTFLLHFMFLLVYIQLEEEYDFKINYIEFWSDVVTTDAINEYIEYFFVLFFGLFTHIITIPLYIIHLQNGQLEILLEELQK